MLVWKRSGLTDRMLGVWGPRGENHLLTDGLLPCAAALPGEHGDVPLSLPRASSRKWKRPGLPCVPNRPEPLPLLDLLLPRPDLTLSDPKDTSRCRWRSAAALRRMLPPATWLLARAGAAGWAGAAAAGSSSSAAAAAWACAWTVARACARAAAAAAAAAARRCCEGRPCAFRRAAPFRRGLMGMAASSAAVTAASACVQAAAGVTACLGRCADPICRPALTSIAQPCSHVCNTSS